MKAAITGTIGSGKSTAVALLREMGYSVFDADACNAQLLQEEDVQKELRKLFPAAFPEGKLEKKILSGIVFQNEEERKKLESLMHPLIRQKMKEEAEGQKLFLAEIPLLFESGFDSDFGHSLLISCQKKTALRRLRQRGYSEEESLSRIAAQMPVKEKKKRASYVIRNDGTLEELRTQLSEWIRKVKDAG